MSLDTEHHVLQTWGSHRPVLQAIMEVLQPASVVECGCGNFSTPVVEAYAQSIITIEHDTRWAKKQKAISKHKNHVWLDRSFPSGIHNGTRRTDITDEGLVEVDRYYAYLAQEVIEKHDFLFVDTFTCARVPAMLWLSKHADIVMLHDLEGNSPDHYSYHELGDCMEGWNHYRFAPIGMVNRTHQVPWTDIYSREPLQLMHLQPVIDRESLEIWGYSAELVQI